MNRGDRKRNLRQIWCAPLSGFEAFYGFVTLLKKDVGARRQKMEFVTLIAAIGLVRQHLKGLRGLAKFKMALCQIQGCLGDHRSMGDNVLQQALCLIKPTKRHAAGGEHFQCRIIYIILFEKTDIRIVRFLKFASDLRFNNLFKSLSG